MAGQRYESAAQTARDVTFYPRTKDSRMTKNMVSLQGRTVVVTGAAQGIGKATTELAIQLGANVVAVDLNGEALGTVLAALPPDRAMKVVGSVTDAELA